MQECGSTADKPSRVAVIRRVQRQFRSRPNTTDVADFEVIMESAAGAALYDLQYTSSGVICQADNEREKYQYWRGFGWEHCR
jgi:hypothetical protein